MGEGLGWERKGWFEEERNPDRRSFALYLLVSLCGLGSRCVPRTAWKCVPRYIFLSVCILITVTGYCVLMSLPSCGLVS